MKSDKVFHIEKMSCAYKKGHPVLWVDEFDILKGKLYFIVGLSGVGKSTFIEALGLMNNLFDSENTGKLIFYSPDDQAVNLMELWNGDNQTMSVFRNKYFSFIFQNTNLMHNFSAGENMCVSQLISGKSMEEAKPVVLQIMELLKLPEDIFNKKVTALSGGQRQRLAFVRAITAEYAVLFGDEPTGNLDRHTGFLLMTALKERLNESERTGIIVSHDLDLALQFADKIIILTPAMIRDLNLKGGTIHPENCLSNGHSGWCDAGGKVLSNPYLYISERLGV